MGVEHMLSNPNIDVACPHCGFEFQLPVAEALAPLIELELTRRVNLAQQQFGQSIREAAQKESDERNRTILAARDKIISEMRVQIDELRRKVDTGSEIVAGGAQELQLESMLKTAFPTDRILHVQKGSPGGDILHEVAGLHGKPVGIILWESKATKSWSNEWLGKIKGDMRAANAAISVIVSTTLPRGVDFFDRVDEVFVVGTRCVLPLAQVLRQVLIDIAVVRAIKQGDSTSDQLYSYISGTQFRHRVMSIVEASIALQGDLDADKRATSRRWARHQRHIDAIVQGIGAMYGDLQVLAELPGVPGLLGESDSDSLKKAS